MVIFVHLDSNSMHYNFCEGEFFLSLKIMEPMESYSPKMLLLV